MDLRTPALNDKRLWVTLVAMGALFVLTLRGNVDGEAGVWALVSVVLGYVGQSQAGQTLRARSVRMGLGHEGER